MIIIQIWAEPTLWHEEGGEYGLWHHQHHYRLWWGGATRYSFLNYILIGGCQIYSINYYSVIHICVKIYSKIIRNAFTVGFNFSYKPPFKEVTILVHFSRPHSKIIYWDFLPPSNKNHNFSCYYGFFYNTWFNQGQETVILTNNSKRKFSFNSIPSFPLFSPTPFSWST